MGLDHEQRLQKLGLLSLAKRKTKDNLTATHMKGGYNGDRIKIFSVSAGDTQGKMGTGCSLESPGSTSRKNFFSRR